MIARFPRRRSGGRAQLAALAGALAALALVAPGCGSDAEPAASSTTAAEPATATTSSASPRSGADATGGEERGDQGQPATVAPEPLTEAGVRRLIGGFLTSGDPAVACRQVVTDALIRSAYGDRSGCAAAQVPGSTADRVRVSGIEIGESTATATAVPSGGVSDGIRLRIGLVEADGTLADRLARRPGSGRSLSRDRPARTRDRRRGCSPRAPRRSG